MHTASLPQSLAHTKGWTQDCVVRDLLEDIPQQMMAS